MVFSGKHPKKPWKPPKWVLRFASKEKRKAAEAASDWGGWSGSSSGEPLCHGRTDASSGRWAVEEGAVWVLDVGIGCFTDFFLFVCLFDRHWLLCFFVCLLDRQWLLFLLFLIVKVGFLELVWWQKKLSIAQKNPRVDAFFGGRYGHPKGVGLF